MQQFSVLKRFLGVLFGALVCVAVVGLVFVYATAPNAFIRQKVTSFAAPSALIELKDRRGIPRLIFLARERVRERYGGGLSRRPIALEYFRGDIFLDDDQNRINKIDTFSLDEFSCGFTDGKSGSAGHDFSDLVYYPAKDIRALYVRSPAAVLVWRSSGVWTFFSEKEGVISGRIAETGIDVSASTSLRLVQTSMKDRGILRVFSEGLAEELVIEKHPTDCAR